MKSKRKYVDRLLVDGKTSASFKMWLTLEMAPRLSTVLSSVVRMTMDRMAGRKMLLQRSFQEPEQPLGSNDYATPLISVHTLRAGSRLLNSNDNA